ncbi:hypothetical protein [Planktothrix agardhii]|jgi:hypothetical protein|uniref:hypothetical protein n=1 Tax=Planktothrix agardhii TaxID=1160 RepID=UPI001D0BCF39|nr:hypothetical protein [Planktothrix agardhii]MCB8760530.1 hypothetical protein [Planktothrix agardhii 1813]MCF3576251.1 hypothetical protein [Planktothrix agardhii 1812]MCF3579923.1 hypothetical protein [Planktothrix agardhii 1811]
MNNPPGWLNESVQDFFSNLNWLGTPARVEKSHPTTSSQSNLTLSVADFFQRIDWEGVPQVGVMPIIPAAASNTPDQLDVTIDDLMGLF